MKLRGEHFVAGAAESGGGESFTAVDPTTGAALEPGYAEAAPEQVDRACAAAAAAHAELQDSVPGDRADLLRAVATGLLALGDELVARVTAETALPRARVEAERGRTVNQLRMFAAAVEEGSWVDARIDRAEPARQPMPKPDLRRMLVGIGPVAVFGASNFPLAYSVAGGDTASALAAGCPVVVKGHPAHPGTSEIVGRVITECVRRIGLPAGTFSLLHGRSEATGGRLVEHPAIRAVGFTGSHRGGRALFDLAAARPEPIPVFAEMGSMNPVVILPRALRQRGKAIAAQLAASATLASGQFCTSPGLVLFQDGEGAEEFAAELAAALVAAPAGPTVHPTIRASYERALGELGELPVEIRGGGTATADGAATAVCPSLLQASAAAVQANPRLRTEIYGPAVLAVRCADAGEMLAVVRALHGHLTGTVHGDGDDLGAFTELVAVLRDRVGRLICNGVPTGVEVCDAMVHGGPYPAATDARFSAVGPSAIARWARPLCWQDWPPELLPLELRDDNPRGIRRVVDGELRLP
ncbi:MAG: aldehyde dehydrogenase (NADP(+)) [Planctomycetes bacterium]|nr:aldehyde dehydrogenase (NADP(+)) [Planctomycetota bacterium]